MAAHLRAQLHKPARPHRPAADVPWLERRHLTSELAAVFDRVLNRALELAA
jgi:hypothetical protein